MSKKIFQKGGDVLALVYALRLIVTDESRWMQEHLKLNYKGEIYTT